MARWRGVALLAVFAGVGAALLATLVFPHGSSNNDEGSYLLQARTLAHGHLFPRISGDARAGLPWFFEIRGEYYVPKYLPVFPALLAASLTITGQYWPTLAVFAAAIPVVCHALARRVGLSPAQALVAAAIVALSPLTLVQSGLALTYVPFATLMALLWLLAYDVLDGRNGRYGWRPVVVGLLGAVCASLRPFDTVLLLLPFVVAFLRRAPDRPRAAGLAVAGALPLLVLLGAYNQAATGNPLRLPFNAAESSDRLGFGVRRLFPEDSAHHFWPLQALQGTYEHLALEPLSWFGGGLLLVGALAVLAVQVVRRVARQRLRPIPLLAQAIGVFGVGYFFFWGPWSASVLWGGPHFLGPFYALALLVPITICVVPLLARARRRAPALIAVLVLAAVTLNGVQLGSALATNVQDTDRTNALLAALDRVPAGDLLLVSVDPSYARHPVSAVHVDPPHRALAGQVDPATIAADQPVSELVLDANPYGVRGRPAFAVVSQRRLVGSSLDLQVAAPPSGWILAVASATTVSICSGPATVSLAAATPEVTCTEPAGRLRRLRGFDGQQSDCPTSECLDVSVFKPRGEGRFSRQTLRRFVVGESSEGRVVYVDASPDMPKGFASVTAASS